MAWEKQGERNVKSLKKCTSDKHTKSKEAALSVGHALFPDCVGQSSVLLVKKNNVRLADAIHPKGSATCWASCLRRSYEAMQPTQGVNLRVDPFKAYLLSRVNLKQTLGSIC